MDHIIDTEYEQMDPDEYTQDEDTQLQNSSGGIEINSPVSQPLKGKRKLTSDVWDHFTRISKTHVECNHCQRPYAQKLDSHGTTTLRRHLTKICRKKPLIKSMKSMFKDAEGNLRIVKKFDQKASEEKLIKAMILHDLPFAFVEYVGIRDWVNSMVPEFKFFGRNTCTTRVYEYYSRLKAMVKSDLERIPSRISLTSDCWTGITGEGYICLTAHYVDENWKLNSKILSFIDMPHPHTGEALASKVHDFLKEWGIEKKVFTITLDNASANDSMQEILRERLCLDNNLLCEGEFFHIRCCAHILNLIVQDGLKALGDALSKIRDSVKYVKASKGRMNAFERCLEGGNVNGVVLSIDVATRWNSTFLMLEKALKYKRTFTRFKVVDKSYKHCPSDEEWTRAEQICELLRPFHKITNTISGSNYPTSNLYFGHIFRIEILLKNYLDSSDEHVKEMATSMHAKFIKYWEHYSVILAMGAIFDPRFKVQFLKKCLGELDRDTFHEKVNFVKKKMYALFKEYQNKYASSSARAHLERSGSSCHLVTNEGKDSDLEYFYGYDDNPEVEEEECKRSHLDIYLEEPKFKLANYPSIDVLNYWKDNRYRLRDLAYMACDILSIPITTVASESSFSIGSRVLNKYRSRLLSSNVQALICARSWLKGFELDTTSLEDDANAIQDAIDGLETLTIKETI